MIKKESLVSNILDLFSSIIIHLHIIFLLRIEILIHKSINKLSTKEIRLKKLITEKKNFYKVILISPK